MVGFLIATHGGFARGILDSIELIAGKQERIDTISILHEPASMSSEKNSLIKSSSWMMVTVWSYSVICCWQVLITRRQ